MDYLLVPMVSDKALGSHLILLTHPEMDRLIDRLGVADD